MRYFSKWLVIVLSFIWLNSAFAVPSVHRANLWLQYLQNGKLDNDWLYFLEINNRWQNNDSGFDQTIFRTAIGRELNERLSFWVGVAFIPFYNISADRLSSERRSFLQLNWIISKHNNFTFSSRTRLEQRQINNAAGTNHRLRHQWTMRFDNALFSNYSPVFYDELFIALNHPSWVSSGIVDQNRVFVGLAHKVSEHSEFQFGYQNRFTVSSQRNVLDHILYLTWRRTV